MNIIRTVDRSDPVAVAKYNRNRKKVDRIVAINAGIYTPRKYSRPATNRSMDGLEYIELNIDGDTKSKLDVDHINVYNILNSYEVRMIKNGRAFKTLRLDKDMFEVYSKAIHAIQRSNLK